MTEIYLSLGILVIVGIWAIGEEIVLRYRRIKGNRRWKRGN
ncbi:hypothetical protein [Sulfurimonas sp.]|nr:hypothetical protein [Sulfurimonas sp.]